MNNPTRGISIQAFMALAITCSLLLLGGVLAWKNYLGVERLMVSAAGESAQQLARTLNERARRLVDPPQNVVRLLAIDPITHATDLTARLDRLPALAESLNANEMLSAIYVGYSNGEFILLRELFSTELQQRFSAPQGTHFLVQTMSLSRPGELKGEWRFYDSQLNLLATQAPPDYHFDPRTRPWFLQAAARRDTALIHPYVFYTTREAGITLAQRSPDGETVVGMDVALADLNNEIGDLRLTPNSKLVVLDGEGTVIVNANSPTNVVADDSGDLHMPHVSKLGIPSLASLFKRPPDGLAPRLYSVDGEKWYGMRAPLVHFPDVGAQLFIAVPAAELLLGARRALLDEIIWISALVLILLTIAIALGHRIGAPLRKLADQVRAQSKFDFSKPVGAPSHIIEIRELSRVMGSMSKTIDNFQAITLALNHETHLDHMLDEVLVRLVEAFGADNGAVYLFDRGSKILLKAAPSGRHDYPLSLDLSTASFDDLESSVTQQLGQEDAQYLSCTLHDRNGGALGVLVLQLAAEQAADIDGQQSFRRFVQGLSGAASVAIETRQLIEAQQQLIDAIIMVLANAIDAKSPYTGRHCERVPELAQMLMDEAVAAVSGPYADFKMSDAERYEFRIASWLHDCGKITSPESVMDKATKLETQYNRIHEIRTRFDILWRDAEIAYWQGIARGENRSALEAELHRRHASLRADFAFVAAANIGGEYMDDEDIERLKLIGETRWLRHFDMRLGLAPYELARLDPACSHVLPTEERLLADKTEHIVDWGKHRPPVAKDDPRNEWGFDMQIPTHMNNYGELYNLSIRRGTLTPEERFKINEHIVQTIIMLDSLPFPEHLKRVPEIAGAHHEKLDGTGYPRRLGESDMGIAERIMTIADIFEALTAADRPYKPAKTLSESLNILAGMAGSQHIDAQLFRLFLTSGVYMSYSKKFLNPDQIDEVDIKQYLHQIDTVA